MKFIKQRINNTEIPKRTNIFRKNDQIENDIITYRIEHPVQAKQLQAPKKEEAEVELNAKNLLMSKVKKGFTLHKNKQIPRESIDKATTEDVAFQIKFSKDTETLFKPEDYNTDTQFELKS